MSPVEKTEPSGFAGMTVAAFESRMAKEMEDLIVRNGGKAQVAPSMREIPLTQNKAAFDFFESLQQGSVDIVIFMTGVGARTLFKTLETKYAKSRVERAFKKTFIVARGPKPVKALTEFGLKASIVVPEPNTWKEILLLLDNYKPVKKLRVVVQEYGTPNEELLQGLRDRGAQEVTSIPVYRWALPEDIRPLKALIENIVKGEAQVALFTTATQIHHVLQVAMDMGLSEKLLNALGRMVIGSIGPVASVALKECRLSPDFEPSHPKMGFFVKEASERASELYAAKKKTDPVLRTSAPTMKSPDTILKDSLFLRACRQEATPRPPIWIMRQAGRYLPGYRQIRAMVSFLDLCKTPDLAAEVTVSAQEVLGVDAAILFADILLISEPMGFQLEFVESGGPVIRNPFRSSADLKRLRDVNGAGDLAYVMAAVKKIRERLKPDIPLIGFAGAPFTLASYLMEGGGSKDYFHTRNILGDIALWDELMEKLVASTVSYLNAQIDAGVQAVQLFDSWVGILAPDEFQRLVLPYLKLLISRLKPGVPVIYFGTQTEPFFSWIKDTGATVVGVDWHVDLDKAWKQLGNVAVQGNLDPSILLTDPANIRKEAEKILRLAGGRPGHIFNLGHGILPQTPVENALALVETVKNWRG